MADRNITPEPVYNPQPVVQQAPAPPQSTQPSPELQQSSVTTSETPITADIINLANNPDLSIETIAHEANRIHKKLEDESEEVVISLR